MHLLDDQLVDYVYRDWVSQTPDLDYFSFAQHCQLSERDTNAHYTSILYTLLKSSDCDIVKLAKHAKEQFKQRKAKGSDMDSKFFVKYSQLWKKGDQDASQRPGASSLLNTSRMTKRQFEAVNELNDIMCSIIVDNAKKMMSVNEAANLTSTVSKPTSSSVVVGDVLDWDNEMTKVILKKTSSYKAIKKLRRKMNQEAFKR